MDKPAEQNELQQVFTKTQLVSFGEYMVSQQREDWISESCIENGLTYEEMSRKVYDSDLDHWEEFIKEK
ncbi:hypothetical protein HZR00_00900 [Elizabethkingia anophelis]|nr:hypothetical protein [Elizabethkingia anophelis]